MAKQQEIYVGKEGAQELYRRIKDEIGKFTSYKKADPEGADRHPKVADPSTKIIYLVEVPGTPEPDHYKEWIWAQPEGEEGNWACIGDTSQTDNSWKQWSEDHGSTSESDASVYIGQDNQIARDDTYVIGQTNTVTVTDDTDYSGTDVVEIGSENTATDAANAYQLGRENTVTGNNLANEEQYPHSMAMNLGRNNAITGEGVNIGKDNVSSTFGVTVGQRNQATDASIAIGEDVNSYSGSISIGHGKPSNSSAMLTMLAMTVSGEEIPAQKVKLDLTEYTYYESAAVFKTASNTYEWGEINDFSTRIVIFVNETLNTYLVGGNSCSYGTVTGYFDENGSFISSTDPAHDVKTYRSIVSTNDVSLNPVFYCSIHPNDGTMVQVPGYVRKTDTQPATGTVLNSAEFAELSARMSINDTSYDNINVPTDDLTAPAMKCYYSGTNRPFYTQYSVYGYRDDNNNFIPYNDVTKYKSNAFAWETIPADELHASVLDPAVVGYKTPITTSRNDSIAIGKSMEADTSSFGIGIGTLYPQVMYEKASDANGWIGYTDTRYQTLTISQVDGSVARGSWITYNRVWFNSTVDDVSWSASSPSRTVMGNSIAIVNTGSSSSYNNYLSGASVGIGNGLKLTDNSFGFGTNLEGDNNSVLVGANLTAQVGGSTVVGRDISVKIGDSDNDSGIITGEYDGGLVAFGMSIAPSPGSVTVGRSGVTTGRGSVAVGASGLSATRGSVVYGRNEVSAEGRATAIGTDGISAKNASITVGLDGSRAEDGSAAFGSGVSAYSGSVSIGREGSSARNGSLSLGSNNQAENGSTSVGAASVARNGSFTFGRNNSSQDGAISIGAENTTSGWSIALGVRNITPYDRGSHATMIGYDNKSNSTVETRTWTDSSTSTSYYLPTNSYYKYSWTEQIYTPDEMGASGYIGSIAFCVDDYTTQRSLSIYLVNTTKSSFTGNYDWISTSSATLVFSGYVNFGLGWNTIQFNTSFYYNNSQNLCVIVVDQTGSYSSSMTFKSMSSGDDVKRTIYSYQDSPSYTTTSPSSHYGYLTGNRMSTQFVKGGSTISIPSMVPLTGDIPTNSILMGALNTSNHFNSILVGVGNQSDIPHIIPDSSHYNTDDDDGFMIAIGRENYVGRNYDIAIGYKSIAYGGENIAIQHSTARGFGNVALEQSSIKYGIRNFAMFDSTLSSEGYGNEIKFNKDVLNNVLIDGSLTGTTNMRRNTILHTNLETSASSTERNIIHIGERKVNDYDSDHTVHVTQGHTFNDNIMIGARNGNKVSFNGSSDIILSSSSASFDRNVLLNNAYAHLSSSGGGCSDNICIDAELDIDNIYYVYDNFITNSVCQVATPYNTLAANAFMARSEVTGSDSNYSIDRNFVFASYMHCTPDRTVSRITSISDITSNVLFGSTANMVQRCFSFSNSYDDPGSVSAYLEYARGVVNFGDANIYDTSDLFSFGDYNEYHRIRKGVIMGNHNTVDAKTENRAEIARVTLIGNDNTIKATYGSDNAGGPLILGDCNNILHGRYVYDNRVIGTLNYVGTYTGLPVWTEEQIASIERADYLRIFKPANRCILVDGTNRYVWRNGYYYYYKHAYAGPQYTAPAEAYVSMSGSAFIYAFNNGTLTDDTFYYITSDGTASTPMPHGGLMDPNCVYKIEPEYTYPDRISETDKYYAVAKYGIVTSTDACNASRNVLIGDGNGVYSNTVGYYVLGTSNKVRNTQVSDMWKAYSISNGFVQGNCNEALDGSNIIIMGNGSTATGHNSVAIGSQLISSQWQTVFGKYNEPISGPDRLTDPANEGDKALLIVGNGYSDTDGDDWMDESKIHRSNAMVVYANGDAEFSGNVKASNIPPAPMSDGRYALNCTVTGGVPYYSWVPLGTVTV